MLCFGKLFRGNKIFLVNLRLGIPPDTVSSHNEVTLVHYTGRLCLKDIAIHDFSHFFSQTDIQGVVMTNVS